MQSYVGDNLIFLKNGGLENMHSLISSFRNVTAPGSLDWLSLIRITSTAHVYFLFIQSCKGPVLGGKGILTGGIKLYQICKGFKECEVKILYVYPLFRKVKLENCLFPPPFSLSLSLFLMTYNKLTFPKFKNMTMLFCKK